MKLRILNHAVRLRLSQTEVEEIAKLGKVSGQTDFINQSLIYSLIKDEQATDVTARFENQEIRLSVPSKVLEKWLDPEEVGFENTDQSQMKILVEKDFECLHKRPGEDESDSFPNPQAVQH